MVLLYVLFLIGSLGVHWVPGFSPRAISSLVWPTAAMLGCLSCRWSRLLFSSLKAGQRTKYITVVYCNNRQLEFQ